MPPNDSNQDTNHSSRTGEFPHVEIDPPLQRRETPQPPTLPEIDIDDAGSTTGIMPVQQEADDDSAQRDDDIPAET